MAMHGCLASTPGHPRDYDLDSREREAFVSDESSINLIISTFLGERRLFMDNIRLSNTSIRIIYDVVYGKYHTITSFLG